MPTPTKEELTQYAQLVRIHESNCKIDYPTPEERAFRLAVMKRLGVGFGLKEMRTVQITAPAEAPAAGAPTGAPTRKKG